MGITDTADDMYIYNLSIGGIELRGEVADNETETSTSYFTYYIPPEYVALGNITFRISARATGTEGGNTETIDAEAYLSNKDGGVGVDLIAVVPQSLNTRASAHLHLT